MLKVHAIPSYNPTGEYNACAYLRVINPLAELDRKGKIDLSISKKWNCGEGCDLVYLQRMCGTEMDFRSIVDLVHYCKAQHKRIIYELDDNLLDLDNISQEEKVIIRLLARNATTLIVSTDMLKQRMQNFNKNIVVIPNMLSLRLIDKNFQKPKNGKIKIGYMGTYTHANDLQMIILPLVKILKKYSSITELELMGVTDDLGILTMLPNVKKISIAGRDGYDKFWSFVRSNINWDIGLAPLKKTEFTICKSDIKFLDYTAMNCSGIFSNHPSYSKTIKHLGNGLLVDDNVETWYNSIEQMILNDELRTKLLENAREEFYEERILENNIWRWEEIIFDS